MFITPDLIEQFTIFGNLYAPIIPKIQTEFMSNLYTLKNVPGLTLSVGSNIRDKLMYQLLKYSDLIAQQARKYSSQMDTEPIIKTVISCKTISLEEYKKVLETQINLVTNVEDFIKFIESPQSYYFKLKLKTENESNIYKKKNAIEIFKLYNEVIKEFVEKTNISQELKERIKMFPDPVQDMSFGATDTDILNLTHFYFNIDKVMTVEELENEYNDCNIILLDKCIMGKKCFRIFYNTSKLVSLNYLTMFYNIHKYLHDTEYLNYFQKQLEIMYNTIETAMDAGIVENISPLIISPIGPRQLFNKITSGFKIIDKKLPNYVVAFYVDDLYCEVLRDSQNSKIKFHDPLEMSNGKYIKLLLDTLT